MRAISGLSGSTYQERLRELGLPSLQAMRLEIDMVQTYKLVKNVDTDIRTTVSCGSREPTAGE